MEKKEANFRMTLIHMREACTYNQNSTATKNMKKAHGLIYAEMKVTNETTYANSEIKVRTKEAKNLEEIRR